MNNRWQANKIGLINFWYYDEQEFPFVKGRMLLRGSNGSGKSVTMQSVIPLLLDGNMSPERLDPFGSRDRKMSSYLLEEEDEREERTGYLYLEFRRAESESYLTIGMGIRARKGKPLDKWYFSLTDGRRIGKDFYLYKKTDEKVTLSKKELENRIQGGGYVFDRQIEYMEYVNRQIFGFETVEEYKEMVDLLIQLRTPKLSKDFKPSVLNEILSNSLQPLSEEDLRPMSEAIENMDTMSMNLKMRQEGKIAAEKINRIFDKYNCVLLLEKAENYDEKRKEFSALEKEEKSKKQELAKCHERVVKLEEENHELNAKKAAMEKERDSLNKSDAVALKKLEMDLCERIGKETAVLEEKQKQLKTKNEQVVETEKKKREEENREYKKEQELTALLEEMQGISEDMGFEEHSFFEEELKNNLQKPFSFETHQKQFETAKENISKGTAVLQEVQHWQRQVDDQYAKREKNQREIDSVQKRIYQLENQLAQIQNEWKEQLYSWNSNNQELVLSEELLRSFSAFAQDYNEKSDFSSVKNALADIRIEKKGILDGRMRKNREEIVLYEKEYEEQRRQLEEWESHREPEPDRSMAVQKNRERLQKLGIPYHEFYKMLEFGQDLDKISCDRLEEALLEMGILDALVIDEQYQEQVLRLDSGCCDKYLFVGKQRAEKSILDVLDLNDTVNDIFQNQRITGILENIAYGKEGITAVSPEGVYRLGVLTGTVTGEYEAGFIGTRAREKKRQQNIIACRERMEQLTEHILTLQKCQEELEGKKRVLEEEYRSFPIDDDLREALKMLMKEQREDERLREEGTRIEAVLLELNEKLKQLKKEALEIANKLYLTCSYEVFQRAEKAAGEYAQYFYQLKSGHELYLQIICHKGELLERLEDLEVDMEQIRYDLRSTEIMLKKEQAEYESVVEQLRLTDYEEIKERLDICMMWLKDYPELVKKCLEEKGQKEQQCKYLEDFLKQSEEKIEVCRRSVFYLEKCYMAEKALDYVHLPEYLGEDVSEIRKYLASDYGKLRKDTVNQELNSVYFANRALLNDYQLTQTELFDDLEEEIPKGVSSPKRMDIHARYQGVKIPFGKLLVHLEEEIRELQELIKSGDRELFEDILANTMSRKIRGKINASVSWVEKMNGLMSAMNTSSGLKLSLRWRSKTAEHEDQLDTAELVNLLKKDYRLMREEEAARLSLHFRSKVEEARRHAKDSGGMVSFYQVMKETLDYRKWFEFQLFYQKSGERQKELTNSAFGTFSGGEKAMSMYVPLFSAVVAKYQGGRMDAPRLISLDEAFAGVDNKNIRDMFRLMTEFEFDFIINSQVLWGDCDTLDALGIYQLIRPENAKFVTVMPYLWNGKAKEMLDNEQKLEQRAAEFVG